MQAIVQATIEKRLAARVVGVISNRPDAPGLNFARAQGIATRVVDHRQFGTPVDRDAFDAELGRHIDEFSPDLVVLAGFMRILGTELVTRYHGRMLNIHPSLLPRFPGLDTHARALAAGDTEHGASVHWVTPELDAGPVIDQQSVPIVAGDTPESLAARVLAVEHELYVRALARCVNCNYEVTRC